MGVPSGNYKAARKRKLASHRTTPGFKPIVKTLSTKTGANQWARLIASEIARGVVLDRSEAKRTKLPELIDRYLLDATPAKRSTKRQTRDVPTEKPEAARWHRFLPPSSEVSTLP